MFLTEMQDHLIQQNKSISFPEFYKEPKSRKSLTVGYRKLEIVCSKYLLLKLCCKRGRFSHFIRQIRVLVWMLRINLQGFNLPCWMLPFASALMTPANDPADPWPPCPGFFGFLFRVWIPSFFMLSGRLTCKVNNKATACSYVVQNLLRTKAPVLILRQSRILIHIFRGCGQNSRNTSQLKIYFSIHKTMERFR
jgi:hypothetical protein